MPAASWRVPPLMVAARVQFRPPLSVSVPLLLSVPPVRSSGPLKVALAVAMLAPLKLARPLIVAPLAKLCEPVLN